MEKAVLKGSRWLLLKAPENLKPHEDHRVKFMMFDQVLIRCYNTQQISPSRHPASERR